MTLHKDANAKCFIVNSLNFPVRHEPVVVSGGSRPYPLDNIVYAKIVFA